MTKFLVSVRNGSEASIAGEYGANIIDVKEPRHGSLGRASWSTIKNVAEITQKSDCEIPVSVALGELSEVLAENTKDWPSHFGNISYAKLGLANASPDWRSKWQDVFHMVPMPTHRVAVAYADWKVARSPHPFDVIEFAASEACPIVLIDTFCKSNGGLFDVLSNTLLDEILKMIRDHGMKSALAGSLDLPAIDALLPKAPDIIAVRGAVCGGDRTSSVESCKVEFLAQRISKYSASATTK